MKNRKKSKLIIGLSILSLFLISSCNSDDEVRKSAEISWENPAPIKQGAPLTEMQLNATANTSGVFTYSPSFGEVLEEGIAQTLTVGFQPDDSAQFAASESKVQVDVVYNGYTSALFSEEISYGALVDADGNGYKTIKVGEQEWMAENLRTTVFRNGESIATETNNAKWTALNSAAYATYDNGESLDFQASHGLLYNWFAVVDSRNIAPAGWHVATQADWETLAANLGGINTAGGKLKEKTTTHWNSPNTGASNSSGFTALPSGRREYTDGSFINLGFNAFWWSATAYNPDYSWYFQMNYDTQNIIAANFHKQYGFAVRCVKNAD